jgi:hypothetical protein
MTPKVVSLEERRKPNIRLNGWFLAIVEARDLKDYLSNAAQHASYIRRNSRVKSWVNDRLRTQEWINFLIRNLVVTGASEETPAYRGFFHENPTSRRLLTLRQNSYTLKASIDNMVDFCGLDGSWQHALQTGVGDIVNVIAESPKNNGFTQLFGLYNHSVYYTLRSKKIDLY